MIVDAEVELHVVLIAHKPAIAGEQTLYEFGGVEQTWADAVRLASNLVIETLKPGNFRWHGSNIRPYAVHPLDGGKRAIHIMKVRA